MNTSALTKRWLVAAAAAGTAAVAVLGFTGAGAAGAASTARIGPRIYTTSQAGYTVGGGRWFRYIATTLKVTPQPQHSAMAPSVTRAEIVLGGVRAHPATLGVWAGGGRGSVGYSYLHHGRWLEGTLPVSPRVGDTVTLSLYYDRHGHDVFSATDVTKGVSAAKTVSVGPTIYTNAEAAGWIDNSITTAPPADTRLWEFTSTHVTTYTGVHGTLLGPWTTYPVLDTTTGTPSGAVVISAAVLWNAGHNFGVWLRTTA